MKLKARVSAALSLVAGLFLILAGTGCSSSGGHAMLSRDTQCLADYQGLGFTHSTAVSPMGDAPFERDLEMTRGYSPRKGSPSLAGVPEMQRADLAR